MICPLCQCEYQHGFTRCSECSAPLVGSLDDPSLTDDPVIQVFNEVDEPRFKVAVDVLRQAGIPFHAVEFEPRNFYTFLHSREFKILIRQSDHERAERALGEVFGGALSESEVGLPEQESLDQSDEGDRTTARELPEKWDGADATTEVWTGDDASFARTLRSCMRENAIPTRTVDDDPGRIHIFVRPEEADHACEILREIMDGTPLA